MELFDKKKKVNEEPKEKQQEQQQEVEPDVEVIISTHNDSNGGHPHVLMDEIDDNNVSVGLTTRPKKGKNHPNYPLEKDPTGKGKKSFMRRQATIDVKNNYKDPKSGAMAKKDYEKAKEYASRAKEKYIAKKEENKKSNETTKHSQ
ncbi:MAG TPA: hypothetical protein DE061_05740 [Clostridiales bacterium]|mgnify:FL=1|nr:hypothetical protein [Clostridiales bacterium]HCH93166.1 hypothetical protein [Clostridiales bacterium]